ncbi:MAG: hypothetical protein OXK82_05640 [Deltaproteobacteria bacterium]|nr:hypothetical protein [Deltaproteobacteria bacterium]
MVSGCETIGIVGTPTDVTSADTDYEIPVAGTVMKAWITLALAVMMALAFASVEERLPHLMRSLVRAGAPPDPG